MCCFAEVTTHLDFGWTRGHLHQANFFSETGFNSNLTKMQKVGQLVRGTLPLLLLFSTVAIIGWVIVPRLIRWKVSEKMVLSPDYNPQLYSAWIHPPMPVYFKVFLFNVTNPEEVQRGQLPAFNQVGPYVFVENRTKVNLVTDEDQDTIKYSEYIAYHFREDLTANLALEDVLTIINVPFVAAAMKISHDLPWPMNEIGRLVLVNNRYVEALFVRKTVREILFSGWNVPFLEKMDEELGFQLLPNNSFSLLMSENDTLKGPFTVSRGVRDRATFANVLRYKDKSEMEFWKKGSSCNAIQGSDGSLFRPFVNLSQPLHFFQPDICRSAYIRYQGDSKVDGMSSAHFTFPTSLLADSLSSEENSCLCVHLEDEPEKCLKRGAMDMGPCREGAPVSISPPHFLHADPTYQGLEGLNPDPEKHDAFMHIEPFTGIILQGSSKLQVNLILKPVRGIRVLSKVPEVMFPLFWADETAKIDPASLKILRNGLFLVWLVELTGKWILPGVCALISIVFLLKSQRRMGSKVKQVAAEEGKLRGNTNFIPVLDGASAKEAEAVPFRRNELKLRE